ncbi:MAG: hypothetical protein Q9173_007061, partial [Seirophora scorigena]
MLHPSAVSIINFLLLLPALTTASSARDKSTNHLLSLRPGFSTFLDPITCRPLAPTSPSIEPNTCLTHTIPSICAKLTFPFPPRGVWQWSVFPGCAMGFFLPPTLARGAGVPTKAKCVEELFGPMVHECAVKGQGMAGMRNVKVLPGKGSVGRAVVESR